MAMELREVIGLRVARWTYLADEEDWRDEKYTQEEYLDFHNSSIADLKGCNEYKLIYNLGD